MPEERSETRHREGRLRELTFLGHIISRDGLKLQTGRKDAIKREEDRASAQRLLGTVGCLQKFCPNLSEMATPLRQLAKKKNLRWDKAVHGKAASEDVQRILSPSPVLRSLD